MTAEQHGRRKLTGKGPPSRVAEKKARSKQKIPEDLRNFIDVGEEEDVEHFAQPRKKRRLHKNTAKTEDGDDSDGDSDFSVSTWSNRRSFFGNAKRLPLKPRTVHEPNIDDCNASRERLALLLGTQGLVERPVRGDGNCQFRALADQLYGSEEYHGCIRRQVIEQLQASKEVYSGFVLGDFDNYVTRMRQDCTWGDHVTLQAAADKFGVKVNVLTDYLTDAFILVCPARTLSQKVLRLSFWAEVHYNSVQ